MVYPALSNDYCPKRLEINWLKLVVDTTNELIVDYVREMCKRGDLIFVRKVIGAICGGLKQVERGRLNHHTEQAAEILQQIERATHLWDCH